MSAKTASSGQQGGKEPLLKLLDAIYLVCIWISGICILIMSVIIPVGIINRYVFGKGAAWAEPVALLCMVIFTFVGAAAAYRAGSHLAVTLLTDRMPEHLRQAAEKLVKILLAILCIVMIVYGFSLCQMFWHQPIAEYPVLSAGQAYIPLPVGFALTLIFVLESLFLGPQTKRPVVTIGSVADEEVTMTIE